MKWKGVTKRNELKCVVWIIGWKSCTGNFLLRRCERMSDSKDAIDVEQSDGPVGVADSHFFITQICFDAPWQRDDYFIRSSI